MLDRGKSYCWGGTSWQELQTWRGGTELQVKKYPNLPQLSDLIIGGTKLAARRPGTPSNAAGRWGQGSERAKGAEHGPGISAGKEDQQRESACRPLYTKWPRKATLHCLDVAGRKKLLM